MRMGGFVLLILIGLVIPHLPLVSHLGTWSHMFPMGWRTNGSATTYQSQRLPKILGSLKNLLVPSLPKLHFPRTETASIQFLITKDFEVFEK